MPVQPENTKGRMHDPETTLARASRGDQAAFADIVRAHQSMVYGLAVHFLRDRALAEELAQEVFLELYRNLATIRSPEHLTFWLRKVASNRCVDQARRRAVRPQIGLDDVPEPASDATPSDPILSEALRKCVGTLPETPRMVLVLRYQEDLDPTEIAAVLDMPVNTVKSHLQRSLALLRAKLTRCVRGVSA
jgi:RNA polymerase sigma-70 factor (ECF subfamily)